MSTALKVAPDTEAKKPRPVFLREFHDQYARRLEQLRVSATLTDTEKWQKLYTTAMQQADNTRKYLAAELRTLADRVEQNWFSDDDLKKLKSIRDGSETGESAERHFEQQVVAPVRAPQEACEKLIDGVIREARNQESSHPLTDTGLQTTVAEEVNQLPAGTWDRKTGRIIIIEPRRESFGEMLVADFKQTFPVAEGESVTLSTGGKSATVSRRGGKRTVADDNGPTA